MRLEHLTATEVILSQYMVDSGLHCDTVIMDDLINEGGEKDMMGLYEVFVINTKKQKVNHENVFARSEERAKLIVAKRETIANWDDEHTEFFVRCIGQWENKKPKEVKIVKED